MKTPEFYQEEDFRVVIWRAELARQLDLSERQVRKMMDQLRADERLTRKGGKTGEWIII